jgi:predicted dehydrogenase
MAKTLRVGMVGYGFMGKAHSNAWRQAPYFLPLKAKIELHTICGRNSAGVQAARAQFGWQYAATEWQELVESPLLDIIDIVTPNDSHAEIAVAAAKAGKHLLCEKPLALNVKQAEAMVAAVQKSKVVNMVCHNYRRVPAIVQARKMIAEGALGEIHHFYARYAQDWLVDPEAPLRWKLQKQISGSGSHGDIGVHIIDLGRYLVGEFKEVCGLLNTFVKERPFPPEPGHLPNPGPKVPPKRGKVDVDDAAVMIGRFENGAIANLEATRYAAGRKNYMTLEVNGSKGSLVFDLEDMNRLKFFEAGGLPDRQGFRDILVLQPGGVHPYANNWWRPGHALGYEHTFIHTIGDFVNACIDRRPVLPSFEDGLKNQRVLQAVEDSVKTGKWVKL